MSRPALALVERSQNLPPLTRALIGLAQVVQTWEMRLRTRKPLSNLEDHILKDIGICRRQAEEEWQKPFWWK